MIEITPQLVQDLLYDPGKPLAAVYAYAHAAWALRGFPPVILDAAFQLAMAAAVSGFVTFNALFIIWFERKIAALLQLRKGPNRVGPFGILQTVADTFKLLGKEDVNPRAIDPLAFWVAPLLVFIPSFAIFLVVPFGPGLIAGDLNIGVLFILAISGLSVIGILSAGWGSANKYSLIGGLRSAAQMVSYEIPMMLTILPAVMLAGSMRMGDIVAAQAGYKWFIVAQPLAFLLFLVAGNAEINRGPFDLPEAESELVAGFNTEYSAMKFSLFFLAEYTNLFLTSAIAVALFLGGWEGPALPPVLWFLLKTYFVVAVLCWARWSFPRIRVDQLMMFSWKYLLPAALLNLLGTAALARFL